MTCQEFENLLHPYVDEEFDAAERSAADSHLAECGTCSRRVTSERRLRQLLRGALADHPEQACAPDALREKVRADWRTFNRRRAARRTLLVSGIAAGLAVVFSAGYASLPKRRERFAVDAVKKHGRSLPAEIQAGAPETLEAWFQGKLDHRVAVPRLRDAVVSEARLSHVQERPAAYIRYKRARAGEAGPSIGVFVIGDSEHELEASPLPEIEVEKRLGYNVAFWRDGEIVYQLVTDLDDRDIRALLSGPDVPQVPAPVLGGGAEVRPVVLER